MNAQIVTALAEYLEAGALAHPGDPETQTQPTTFVLPMFRTHGRPPPLADNMRAMTRRIVEALLYHLETNLDCTIITNTELAQLRNGTDTA